MIIPKKEILKYKRWVEKYGYAKDINSILWFFNSRKRARRDNGYYIITVGKQAYRVETVADQFIEGAKC